jgi:ATP-dependent Lon protease
MSGHPTPKGSGRVENVLLPAIYLVTLRISMRTSTCLRWTCRSCCDVVVFPHMVIPLFVGRPKSIKALEAAMEAERRIMLVAQKAAAKDEPSVEDMFEVGCVSTILQMLKLPDGTVKVLVEGQQRARVNQASMTATTHFTANGRRPSSATEAGEQVALRSRRCAAPCSSSSTSTSS